MQGIADIFLSFFYFPGPAYPQYLLRPFCRPPTASSGAAVPIADENRRCTQRSAVFRCRTGCGNGSEVSGGRFRHDFSRKNMTDNVLQEGDIIQSKYVVRRRDRTIHKRMREYLEVVKNHPELETTIVPIGDGITISVKK